MIKFKLFHPSFSTWGRTNPTYTSLHVSVLHTSLWVPQRAQMRFCQHKIENLKLWPLHFTSGSWRRVGEGCRRVGEGWQLSAAWGGQNVWFLTQNNTSHVHVFSKTFKLNWCRHKSNSPNPQGLRDGTKGVSGKVQPPGLQALQTSWSQDPALVGESSPAHIYLHSSSYRMGIGCVIMVRTLPEAEEPGEEGPRSFLCSCQGNLDGKIPVNKAGERHCTDFSPCRPEPRQVSVSSTGCYKMTLFL